MYRRRNIATPPSQAALEAWIEEGVDDGTLEVPGGMDGFLANKADICRADWSGPPKPQADDIKAQKAHQGYRDMGVMTDEMICADLGVDRDDVYRTRAFEKAERERLGIHGGVSNGGTDIDNMDDPEPTPAVGNRGTQQ